MKMSKKQPHVPRLGQLKNWNPPCDLSKLPKCTAKAKSTGQRCGQPAMKNGKCFWHGGKSSGPPQGNQNALTHGLYTSDRERLRKQISELLAAARDTLKQL